SRVIRGKDYRGALRIDRLPSQLSGRGLRQCAARFERNRAEVDADAVDAEETVDVGVEAVGDVQSQAVDKLETVSAAGAPRPGGQVCHLICRQGQVDIAQRLERQLA